MHAAPSLGVQAKISSTSSRRTKDMRSCGLGVVRATYFGRKVAYKIPGDQDGGRTAFDDLPYQTKLLYTGNPWFMPILLNWHSIADRLGLKLR